MRILKLQQGIIYGPIHSRRLGLSLGLNLLPTRHKLCSFNCVYCHYGWTKILTTNPSDSYQDFPTPEEFGIALKKALVDGGAFDYITFSGNGEPTLHPQFPEIVTIAKELKERYAPKARLAILSNSTVLKQENIRRALDKLEVKILKLDAGDVHTFRTINRPAEGVNFDDIIKTLKGMQDIILQTVFVDGTSSNVRPEQLMLWMERVGEIRPREAQIYSIDRPPADHSLKKVSLSTLEEIARETEKTTGVKVNVFGTSSR
ncbi:MAG: radical SAM protein [candidate division KSB1 bacterium]|nr:radical SAM protein [candidate division KSB1 bacterium]